MTIDPVEKLVEDGLRAAGIEFVRDHESDLDFYLPALDVHIECKQFPTDRVVGQLRKERDVLLVQGVHAARVFAEMISKTECPCGRVTL